MKKRTNYTNYKHLKRVRYVYMTTTENDYLEFEQKVIQNYLKAQKTKKAYIYRHWKYSKKLNQWKKMWIKTEFRQKSRF